MKDRYHINLVGSAVSRGKSGKGSKGAKGKRKVVAAKKPGRRP